VTPKPRSSRVPSFVRFLNPVFKSLLALGVPMGPDVLLTVRGRRSGLPRSTPVAVAEIDGRLWLVSPWGEVDWVRNLRAAGHATITSGRRKHQVTATELAGESAVSFFRDVLNPYLQRNAFARWIVRNLDTIPEDPIAAAEGRFVFELRRQS
jgi:deazaflavin-dependent oxidoreductase (nitroreductase family)